jgi:hypothetical protein
LANHSHLYGFLAIFKRKISGEETFVEKLKTFPKEDAELQEVWNKTRELILEVEKVGKQTSQARTILLWLPGLGSIELNDQSALKELAKTDLPIVSVFDSLQKGKKGNSMNLRFRYDGHYNEFANRLIAEELQSFIIN